MKIVLIANASASSVTARTRVVIQKALSADHEVELAETVRRGHATRLAKGAAAAGADLVVVLGGDGTLNEAANGVAGTKTALAHVEKTWAWMTGTLAGTIDTRSFSIDVTEYDWSKVNNVIYEENGVVIRSIPAIHFEQSASFILSRSMSLITPALFSRMSSVPKVSLMPSNIFWTSSNEETSA